MRDQRTSIAILSSVLLLSLWSVPEEVYAQSSVEPPVVQLYTMGVGTMLFERFGHAAMCLHYERSPDRDLCFNYGTADFTTPVPLTMNFLRGKADFWVSVTRPEVVLKVYRGYDRTVWRQDLPLSHKQARAIEQKLISDAQPENRHFTYHHYFDNCTTRLRDVINEATDGQLRTGSDVKVGHTFRDFSRRGFAEETWLLVGSDLFLGRMADSEPTLWKAMFLPSYLQQHVQDRFGVEPVVVYERQGRAIRQNPESSGRFWFLIFGLILAVPFVFTRKMKRIDKLQCGILGFSVGLIGLILWGLALISPLPELRWNEVLLVLWPTDLALPFLSDLRRRRYATVRLIGLGLVLLLLVIGVFRQPMWFLIAGLCIPWLAIRFLQKNR